MVVVVVVVVVVVLVLVLVPVLLVFVLNCPIVSFLSESVESVSYFHGALIQLTKVLVFS